MGRPLSDLARQLRRDERTIRDWLSGRAKVPWWVPEIMRLKKFEADIIYRQMFWAVPDKPSVHQLGVVDAAGNLQLVDRRRPPLATTASSSEPAAAAQ
jgi:hypothetical protein